MFYLSTWLIMLLRMHGEGKISEERLNVWLGTYLSGHPVQV